ncbi:unnamed protein product, partial [Protopolystoma xenopodis]
MLPQMTCRLPDSPQQPNFSCKRLRLDVLNEPKTCATGPGSSDNAYNRVSPPADWPGPVASTGTCNGEEIGQHQLSIRGHHRHRDRHHSHLHHRHRVSNHHHHHPRGHDQHANDRLHRSALIISDGTAESGAPDGSSPFSSVASHSSSSASHSPSPSPSSSPSSSHSPSHSPSHSHSPFSSSASHLGSTVLPPVLCLRCPYCGLATGLWPRFVRHPNECTALLAPSLLSQEVGSHPIADALFQSERLNLATGEIKQSIKLNDDEATEHGEKQQAFGENKHESEKEDEQEQEKGDEEGEVEEEERVEVE